MRTGSNPKHFYPVWEEEWAPCEPLGNPLTPVVRRSDNAIHWIKLYSVDNAIRFAVTYTPDSGLSVG